MFKSLKRSGEKVKERVDFKFGFHATRIPLAGWEKLVVSVIPLDTRRVSYKTTRAICKNGNCNWGDNVIETTKLLKDTKTHEYDEKLYKFIVSTGSSRSGVLGEAVVNVADYTVSNNPSQIALTLKNCNFGTILHATITCLTPRSDGGLERAPVPEVNELVIEDGEDVSGSDEDDMEDSDQSGNITTGSASSNTSAPASNQQISFTKDRSGGARISIDPLEPSTPRQNGNGRAFSSDNVSSPTSSLNSSGRHDKERDRAAGRTLTSQDSNNSSTSLPPAYGRGSSHANGTASGTVPYSTRSNNDRDWATQRSFGSRAASDNGSRGGSQNDLGGREALQADLAAAETTIEELRTETVSSQILNRKLTIEVENMKQLLNTHKRHGAESDMEMTTLIAERDRLKVELEQMRSSKMAFEERETGEGNARWKVEDAQQTIRELTDEVRYQKDLNVSLGTQVRKTQDSNMELVLAIKDVEDALEQHRKEIETLKTMNHKLQESLSTKQRDSLESLSELEREWKLRFAALEEEKKALESQLASFGNTQSSSKDGDELRIKGLEKMVERLTQDVEDLEKESRELANENVELRKTLVSSKKEIVPDSQLEDSLPGAETGSLKLLVAELKSKLAASEDNLRRQLARNKTHVDDMQRLVAELRTGNQNLQKQLEESRDEAEQARRQADYAKLRSVSLQNGSSGDRASRYNAELERSLADARAALASREQELSLLEESSSRAEEERSIALEKAAGLEDDMVRLKGEIRIIVDAKAMAENMCAQLQREKEELEERLRGATAETGEAAEQIQETKVVFAQLYQRSTSQNAKIRELEECLIERDRKKAALEKTVRELLESELFTKSRVHELELQLSARDEEVNSLNLIINDYDERFFRQERARFNSDHEKCDLRTLIQTGEEREKLLEKQVSTLQEEVSLTKGHLETLSNSRRSLDRRESELLTAKDDLVEENLKLTERISELLTAKDDLEEENLKLTKRIDGFAKLLVAKDELEEDNYKLTKQFADLRIETRKADEVHTAIVKEREYFVEVYKMKYSDVAQENLAFRRLRCDLEERIKIHEEESARDKKDIRSSHERISTLEQLVASKTIQSSQEELRLLEGENEGKMRKLVADLEFLKKENGKVDQYRQRVLVLEGELRKKVEALDFLEKKLREKDFQEHARSSNGGNPSYFQRSLSRSNSMINSSPSREAKELYELREKVKLLEGHIKKKAMDLDAVKRDYSSKESDLYNKIELLQMANEQLIQGGPDLGMDQLQMELQRLQNQNSVLARRERELVSQLSTQEVLHKEVQRLQEVLCSVNENEQLETRFNRFKETAKFGNLMDRVITLETELAEAMEANAMYKTQLRNAFATQQNVQAAALNNYGDVDEIITSLVRLKGHSSKLEGDVKDLRERYATMSLRYAEVEAQREELVMTVRNLRNGKKM
ncbi:hypothetical protein Mapa_001485 [Marchantia paleacea]|nr:hypothetical protein Mapa_001485 [Marchantia paleacea]